MLNRQPQTWKRPTKSLGKYVTASRSVTAQLTADGVQEIVNVTDSMSVIAQLKDAWLAAAEIELACMLTDVYSNSKMGAVRIRQHASQLKLCDFRLRPTVSMPFALLFISTLC